STLALAAAQPPASLLSPPPPSGTGLPRDQCIQRHDNFRGHTIADRRTMLVDISGRIYRFTFTGDCLNTPTRTDPRSFSRVRNRICRPSDIRVSVGRGGGAAGRCIVDSIVRMPPEEVAALPRRLQP